ncbi:MAG: hypothetical protein QNL45_05200 [Nitrospirota bacterium]|nr:hypothetical protein [Nitrospirota bacterium]
MAQTELMPRLVVGYSELDVGKLKKGKGFLKSNFGLGPKHHQARRVGKAYLSVTI